MKIKNKILIFISSLVLALAILRIFLFIFPHTNLNIGKYNIHHFFIGAFLSILVIVFFIANIVNNFVIVIAGFSSALILDQVIYLIATDGSDTAYLSSVSLWGAIILTTIVLIITSVLYYIKTNRR